jgi:hypothetical protein
MQVKCLYKPLVTFPFLLVDNSLRDNAWSALLNTYADSTLSAISIDVDLHTNSIQGGGAKFRSCKGSALYMVGGRKSIVAWLKTQGEGPKITHPGGAYDLYAIVMRKRELFAKNLTAVAITALPWTEPGGSGWEKTGTYDLRFCPEVKMSAYTGLKMCEFTPRELGTILERCFRGEGE